MCLFSCYFIHTQVKVCKRYFLVFSVVTSRQWTARDSLESLLRKRDSRESHASKRVQKGISTDDTKMRILGSLARHGENGHIYKERESALFRERKRAREGGREKTSGCVREREKERERGREREGEKERERLGERKSKRAKEQKSKRAKEQEKKRAREQERKREREKERK